MAPQPRQRHRRHRFRLFPVRSPLLRESLLFSFPGVTKMFQFTPFASAPYIPPEGGPSDTDDPAFAEPGCPIRKSRDLCLLDGSSGLIAACHVLHRLLAPRHPPCTLGSLTLDSPSLGASRQSLFPGASPIQLSKSSQESHRRTPMPAGLDPAARALHSDGRLLSVPTMRLPGGDDRNRTGNLWLAKPALSRLSYIPLPPANGPYGAPPHALFASLVGPSGFEPLTSPLSGARSDQLSYRPP